MDKKNYTQYKQCYVAYIDIQGFSKYVENNSFDMVQRALLTLKTEEFAGPSGLKLKYGIDEDDIQILCISDNVIISIEKDVPKSLDAIVWLCSAFQTALFLNNHLLMRGGISLGDFFIDDKMLFGKGYQQAVEIEHRYNIPRIVLDKTIDISTMTDKKFVAQGKYDGKYFVDYMTMVSKNALCHYKLGAVKDWIIKSMDDYKNDEKLLTKYIWTMKYYNATLKRQKGLSQFIIEWEDRDCGQP